jgi:hypothetical protein
VRVGRIQVRQRSALRREHRPMRGGRVSGGAERGGVPAGHLLPHVAAVRLARRGVRLQAERATRRSDAARMDDCHWHVVVRGSQRWLAIVAALHLVAVAAGRRRRRSTRSTTMNIDERKSQLIDLLRSPASAISTNAGIDRNRLAKRKQQLANNDQPQQTAQNQNSSTTKTKKYTNLSVLSLCCTNNRFGISYFDSIENSITFCESNVSSFFCFLAQFLVFFFFLFLNTFID